ncbi:protein of unknown function [Actinobaculum suis]|uniref:DUF4916 domain-containing protein n=2 Tax=Actinobaculum suis TaxID=1657 RepID=A0A1G7D6Y7_9ACTO|nr:protein of unknown function [Actinobaculum suis]VDG76231.1 Uncharacterised protein [Actinobaculum suis]
MRSANPPVEKLGWQYWDMSEIDAADMGPWLNPDDLEFVRGKVPIIYVDIVPVRLDDKGRLELIGMLLRLDSAGISREFPAGRVLFHEPLRDAVLRHVEKDLGLMALPQIPSCMVPFTIQEYFPTPSGEGTFFDARQHRIDLAYIVPIQGDCNPGDDALEFSWFTPGEARTPSLQKEMAPGHAELLRRALAYLA